MLRNLDLRVRSASPQLAESPGRILSVIVCLALSVMAVVVLLDNVGATAERRRRNDKRAPAPNGPAASLSEPAAAAPDDTSLKSEANSEGHPLLPAIEIAKSSLATLDNVRDYTATFSKRELVGRKYISQTMKVKVRHEPFSVYLNFQGAEAGREAIYVAGANRGNMLVHESGIASIAGTLNLAPNGPEVMKENRHPVTRLGIQNLLKVILAQWERETQFGEIEVKYFPNAKLGDVACKVIQTSHPQPRREFPFHMTRLYIAKDTNLPVRVEQYGFPRAPGETAPLIEEYTYSNVRPNVQLTDLDFNPRNPQYRF